MNDDYTESSIIEQPAIDLFKRLGYETANCYSETFGSNSTLGRLTSSDVVLVPRLRKALEKLNPDICQETLALAIDELTKDRSSMNPVQANMEISRILKDGVKVTIRVDGQESIENVRVIDWNDPEKNDFFLASQFWVSGEIYKRRADLVGFVNGLPLIFIELKASHRRIENAYRDNLRDYKNTIPQLFWYNALVILSNGIQSKIGTITSEWEHFSDWKKVNKESERGAVSLVKMIMGTCEKHRLLDIVENFTLFSDAGGASIKIIARNHQYLGVNNAFDAVQHIRENHGKLGVFWHTQGSGKSYSMVFFSQKILRKKPGNWTFLVVTDRQELDGQIYGTFSSVGAVTEPCVQATSIEHLKQLLRENHRNIFTLIQKFQERTRERYPMLSERDDIIVITDEAHRSQYDTLAMNMRDALPNASFIAFTGTPLIAGEEKTREVFGDYVSIYNFRESVEDGATVPLYYENRIPELQLKNKDFNEELQRIIDEANLDEYQQKRLEREFARQYHLITRDDRLEKIAEDMVSHFMGRGQMGKAMFVAIDRFTTVRMYDKVQKYWKQYMDKLRTDMAALPNEDKKVSEAKLKYMEETDMAVVISSSQNEVEDFKEKGLDILTHRKRMLNEDLETKFKDSDNHFRIVFVCSMWITGFDVPSLSTIYLDKPMHNHTLMQTIARANRVFKNKTNGLIVDYIGVFRDLQKALAIYGSGIGGAAAEGEMPIKDKQQLVRMLKKGIEETTIFCNKLGIDPAKIRAAEGIQKLELLNDAVDALLVSDETKKKYMAMVGNINKLYSAILPDPMAGDFNTERKTFEILAAHIRALMPEGDISDIMEDINSLLDRSIDTKPYEIYTTEKVDLSRLDIDALKKLYDRRHKRIIVEQLRWDVEARIKRMIVLNKSRMNYLEQLQRMIEDYNSGSLNVQLFFDKLMALVMELNEEEKRGVKEQLSEEELALFDILTKPEIDMTEKDKNQVKKVARELLTTLNNRLVIDWRKRQQTRAEVLVTIRDILDELPRVYSPEIYDKKCDLVYQHIYDSYYGEGHSVYA